MAIFLVWLLGSVAVSFLAGGFNRSRGVWFMLSVFLSPIISLTMLLIAGNDGKKCPKCAEIVKPDAQVCKHCNNTFEVPNSLDNTKTEHKFSGWER